MELKCIPDICVSSLANIVEICNATQLIDTWALTLARVLAFAMSPIIRSVALTNRRIALAPVCVLEHCANESAPRASNWHFTCKRKEFCVNCACVVYELNK